MKASVNLLENNGRIFFFQPDIGVIASDENLEKAYGKFLDARRTFWSEVEGAGLKAGGVVDRGGAASVARDPVPDTSSRRTMVAELGLFAAKFCIALVITCGLVGVVAMRAVDGISGAIAQATPKQLSLADVTHKTADILKDIRSLSPQDREELLRNVGEISREFQPIVDAWRNPPPHP